MYFLTDEEKKQLLRGYLPKARMLDISEELRGWNWHQPPLAPVYEQPLALYEVASYYCPTGRDVYLRRVEKVSVQPNAAMLKGTLFHQALVRTLIEAKRLIYQKSVENFQDVIKQLHKFKYSLPKDMAGRLGGEEDQVREELNIIINFETARIAARIQEILVKQPYINEDSLVALALPVVVEQKLNGSFLGLSPHLSTDAYTFSEPMILDLKFGLPRDFHRLATTGYALAMEAIYEFPVNLGCLVYGRFKNGRLTVHKDIHIIDDELRQWFIEARDEKMRIVFEEYDPGIAGSCYETCPFYDSCH